MEKRHQRLVTDHDKESKHRHKAEERAMDLEKQMAIYRVEQSESSRKFEDLQENKTRVGIREWA